MRKGFIKRFCALGMTAVLLLGTAGCAEQDETGKEEKDTSVTAYAAEYPEMVPYPEIKGGFDYDRTAYEAWEESINELRKGESTYKDGIWDFAKESMQEFLSDAQGKNRVYSPLNVYMALAMLAEVTDGDSRAQILELLRADTIETLRTKANTLWRKNYCDDGRRTCTLGSSLWLSDSTDYVQSTIEELQNTYYASAFKGQMGSAEMNAALQSWLNEQTGGLLEEQAAGVTLDPATILALATTVYFQAKWKDTFNESVTEKGIFHTSSGDENCDFMKRSGTDSYFWGDRFSAVNMRFESGGSMVIVLPDEGVDVEALLTDESVMKFLNSPYDWENRKTLIVNKSIPKFDVVSDVSLIEGLKALGVKDVFAGAVSDFSPLTTEMEGIFVSDAKHAARVKIDEEGCEAAAYTVMLMAGAAMPPKEEVDFIADRPFLFMITGEDGLPLFVGIVNQP